MRFLGVYNNFGANFCDTLLRAIRPGDKVVGLEDQTTIQIHSSGLWTQQRSQHKNEKLPNDHEVEDKTPSF